MPNIAIDFYHHDILTNVVGSSLSFVFTYRGSSGNVTHATFSPPIEYDDDECDQQVVDWVNG
jgi:hypothetical protein